MELAAASAIVDTRLANEDPLAQQADMAAVVQLIEDLEPQDACEIARKALREGSHDDRTDILIGMAQHLSPQRLLLVSQQLETVDVQELRNAVRALRAPPAAAPAAHATPPENFEQIGQRLMNAHYQQHGGEPTRWSGRDQVEREVVQALHWPAELSEDQQTTVGEIASKIMHTGGDQPRVTVLPVVVSASGDEQYTKPREGIVVTAIFRIEVPGRPGEAQFIDARPRSYDDPADYQKNNDLPVGARVVMPKNWRFDLDENLKVKTSVGDAHIEGDFEHFRRVTHSDLVVAGVGAVAGLALIATGRGAKPGAAMVQGSLSLALAHGSFVAGGVYAGATALASLGQDAVHGASMNPIAHPEVALEGANVMLSLAGAGEAAAALREVNLFSRATKTTLAIANAGAAGAAGYQLLAHWNQSPAAKREEQALMFTMNFVGLMAHGLMALRKPAVQPLLGEVPTPKLPPVGEPGPVMEPELGLRDTLPAPAPKSNAPTVELQTIPKAEPVPIEILTVTGDVAVPCRKPAKGFDFAASYYALRDMLNAITPVPAQQVLGGLYGAGKKGLVYEYKPDSSKVLKLMAVPEWMRVDEPTPAMHPGPITKDSMYWLTREIVTLNRAKTAGMSVLETSGLMVVETPQGKAIGLLMEKVQGGVNLKDAVDPIVALNRKDGRPLLEGIEDATVAAFNEQSLRDMDRNIKACLDRGVEVIDPQYLLDPETGRVLLFDPLSIDPWHPHSSPTFITESISLRNAIARHLHLPEMPMPALEGVQFQGPWWDGGMFEVVPASR